MPTTAAHARPTTRRTPMRGGLIGALNTEWARLGDQPTPAPWREHPVLAPYPTPAQLLQAISAMTDPRAADPHLHALLTQHADGDQLAGRTVLQTMLGKVARLARTAYTRANPDPTNAAIEAMWTAIHTYPLRRRTSIAGNLALDALARLDPARELTELPASTIYPGDPVEALEALMGQNRLVEDSQQSPDRLAHTLAWAADHQVISAGDLRLLARVHLGSRAGCESLREIADDLGLSHAAARQRHSRAVRAVACAVADQMTGRCAPVTSALGC